MKLVHDLIFSATMKRAALIEEFLQEHWLHEPTMEIYQEDPFTNTVRCPCGAALSVTITVSVDPRLEYRKRV